MKKVEEELQQLELHLIRLEYKMNILKDQKQIPKLRSTQDTLITQNSLIIPSSIKPPKRKKPTNLPYKSYAQIVALGLPKITIKKAWIKITSNSQRQKAITSNTPKVKSKKKG